jgi:hypothetical protein
VSYFPSTGNWGSHNLVAGFDNFKEWRKNDKWQSGSQYNIAATTTIVEGDSIYPVFRSGNTTFINLPALRPEPLEGPERNGCRARLAVEPASRHHVGRGG